MGIPARSKKSQSASSRSTNEKRQRKEDQKRQLEQEIEELHRRVQAEAPARGYAPPLHQVVAFSALPLSQATQRGLVEGNFSSLTAIQNACVPHALAGRDILGAAKTGSGKTLAYLIPVLEHLFRRRFAPADGPGAVVLSPTRELAIQIFQVLRTVGRHHTLSVGLLIGGKKDFHQEQQQIGGCNLIIATPGRLLQHLEQTPYLDMSQVQMLVLDEADRVLDLGFRTQLERILEYLPAEERQTMLFSATQTRDVASLATLSLREPEYLGVHDKEKTDTPEALQQSYVVVPLEHKLNAVYSFLKSHLKDKSIIFWATCAQVRHAHDLFCSLRPGVPVMALHGKLAQEKRTQIYFDFLKRPHAVLLATDIAARGLDFPNVDWVVQADAPEDRDMYVHRAGRTARFRSGGQALLMLTPAEEEKGFVEHLLMKGKKGTTTGSSNKNSKLPLQKLRINPTKATVVTERAASLVAANPALNALAKKAFQSYVRCIHLMPHKQIFDAHDLDLDGFGRSLGLAATPNLRFLKATAADRTEFREQKNVNQKLQRLKEQIKAEKLAKKLQRMGTEGQAAGTAAAGRKKKRDDKDDDGDSSSDDESDEELLVSKRGSNKKSAGNTEGDEQDEVLPDPGVHEVSKPRHAKKIRVAGGGAVSILGNTNKHVVFNEDGEEDDLSGLLQPPADGGASMIQDKRVLEEATDSYVDKVRARLQSTRAQDAAEEKERVRQKHKKRRLEKGQREEEGAAAEQAVLGISLGSDNGDDSFSSSDDDSSSSSSSEDDGSQSVSSPSSSSEGGGGDVKTQEEMALALIRGAT